MTVRILNSNPTYDYRRFCKTTLGEEYNEIEWKPKNEKKFWYRQIWANHSTLRCIRFMVEDTVPRNVAMQLVRHTAGNPQPEVESSRPDWTGKPRSNDPYEMKKIAILYTAESFVSMAEKRLCNRTESNTRETVQQWINNMRDSEIPFLQALAARCMPRCKLYGGFCPEIKRCGKYPPIY